MDGGPQEVHQIPSCIFKSMQVLIEDINKHNYYDGVCTLSLANAIISGRAI